jgi:hypothetical protein
MEEYNNKTINDAELDIYNNIAQNNYIFSIFWIININTFVFTLFYYYQIKKSSFLWNKVYLNILIPKSFWNNFINFIKMAIIQESIIKIYFKQSIKSIYPDNNIFTDDLTDLVFTLSSLLFFTDHKNNKIIMMNFLQTFILTMTSYGLPDLQSLLLNIYSKMLFNTILCFFITKKF